MLHLTDSNFAETLAQGKPVVVDFSAVWCGPCQMMKPIVEELASEFDGKIIVAGMDVDDNDKVPAELGIMNIPCFIFFRDGELVSRHVGACSKDELRRQFLSLLGESAPASENTDKKGLFGKFFGK